MAHMRIGFHTAVGGYNDGITEDYFVPLDNAGVPIILKAVDDFGICEEVLNLSESMGSPHNRFGISMYYLRNPTNLSNKFI